MHKLILSLLTCIIGCTSCALFNDANDLVERHIIGNIYAWRYISADSGFFLVKQDEKNSEFYQDITEDHHSYIDFLKYNDSLMILKTSTDSIDATKIRVVINKYYLIHHTNGMRILNVTRLDYKEFEKYDFGIAWEHFYKPDLKD